ncbi:tetratricopeptide repeat protein [Inquilinus sp. CAU 1745]|uniref:tetratricopeptide repeat protein n=1 Tax=Inquilinus sp. CAU 1745 TaxID=3140369 RepID=UPI00325B2C69
MADLFREVDEALREDRAKSLWSNYGTAIVALAVGIVLATAAFVAWERYSASRNTARTDDIAAAMAVAEQGPAEAAAAMAAVVDGSGGAHRTLARFYEAGFRAEAGDQEAASIIYRSIATDDGVAQPWRDLALLLAVQSEIDAGDPAALSADLEALAADDSPWRFTARELQGLLALRQDDRDAALEIFRQLSEAPAAPGGVRARASELTQLLSR